MNVLLLGSGGREHALAWKLAQSPRLRHLYIAPGNAGTRHHGENLPVNPMDFEAVLRTVREKSIDLVVVGPEQPLVAGIADFLEKNGVAVVGPNQEAAQLEGSKEFSKAFMQRHGIPTAGYAAFESGQLEEALAYVQAHSLPIVVKADGLAAGKGVLICQTANEAAATVQDMLSGAAFGDAGRKVVIEEFLTGIEISMFVLTDGEHHVLLPSAKDYKRIGEGDTGPNTGGMGSVSPVPFADEAFISLVNTTIVEPTVEGLKRDGIVYKGFIFIGLMVQNGVPYVLEYNCRMGDPETQSVVPRIDGDLLDLCEGVAKGDLHTRAFGIKPQTCAGIVMVSGGYPDAYDKGKVITGLDSVQEGRIFHAGTRLEQDQVLTDGGRVLFLSGEGNSIREAISQALRMAEQVQFDGAYFRTDIGRDLMNG